MRKLETCKCIGCHKIVTKEKAFWLSYCTVELPDEPNSTGLRAFSVFEQLEVGEMYDCISTSKGYVIVGD